MRLAVIAHEMHREWLLQVFSSHPEFCAKVVCFVDWIDGNKMTEGIPAIVLGELGAYEYDAILIAVPWPGRVNQLYLALRDSQITGDVYVIRPTMIEAKRDFICGETFDPFLVDKIAMDAPRPFMHLLETHVCDDCNLNCKACTHFAPFVSKRQKADIGLFEKSMLKISEIFSGIGLISILGGEALLEPDLCVMMIRISRKYFPYSGIMLTTNGLLVPAMKPEFWDDVRTNDVFVNVTPYPPTRKMVPAILDIFHKNNVKYDPRIETQEIKTFAKFMSLEPIYDAQKNNEMCAGAGCYQLRDGYLGKCPESMYIDFMAESLGKLSTDLRAKDAVNILEAHNGMEVLKKLCAPCDMCRKCAKELRKDVKWERIDKVPDPNDWLICSPQ